jgi:uncharacterized protein YecE (DUF72 family)
MIPLKPAIHIATSGWYYAHWRHRFYAWHLPAKEYLRYYARHFTATEINTTFYQLPAASTVYAWKRSVPPSFIFCPKMYRGITHQWKLSKPESTLPPFFDAIGPLKDQVGPILIQLPPSLDFKTDAAGHFFQFLRDRYSEYNYALETRHISWLRQEAKDMLESYGIGFVIAESGNKWPSAELITSRHIYLRFHGPDGSYGTCYPDTALSIAAGKIKAWKKKGYEVWAFFNNDGQGYAVRNAQFLRQSVDGRAPSVNEQEQLSLFG